MSANHGDATIFHRLVDDTCNWEANGIPPLSLKCSVREVLFLLTVRPCVGQLSYTISSWAVGQVPLDFWLATATSDKFLGFPNCGLFSKGLLPASSQDVKTTCSDQHLLFNNTSLVRDYSSSSTIFWSQLMGFIFWCLPENMVPPKSHWLHHHYQYRPLVEAHFQTSSYWVYDYFINAFFADCLPPTGHLWFSEVEIISFQSFDPQFRCFEGVSNCRLELNWRVLGYVGMSILMQLDI